MARDIRFHSHHRAHTGDDIDTSAALPICDADPIENRIYMARETVRSSATPCAMFSLFEWRNQGSQSEMKPTTNPLLQCAVIGVVIWLAAAPLSAQTRYRLTELGSLGSDATWGLAINSAEQVVGNSNDRPFLWQAGTMQDLGTFGGLYGFAQGINDAGQVVGTAWQAYPGGARAFRWEGGVMTDLGTLGGSQANAAAINSAGQVTGGSWLTDSDLSGRHAFMWDSGAMIDMGTLGGSTSGGLAINDLGQVVGVASTAGDTEEHAFLWDSGVMHDLGSLGGAYAAATGINNAGHIVGASTKTDGTYRAFIWKAGVMDELDGLAEYPGSDASGINESGQIVGAVFQETYPYEQRAAIWDGGVPHDLNALIESTEPLRPFVTLTSARAINDRGSIVSDGVDTRSSVIRAYLLTPIPGPYAFQGLFAPVDNPPIRNLVQAGRAIPVKFSLGGDQGLDIFEAGYPASQRISCDTSAPQDLIEETVTAGSSSLSYAPGSDQYNYVWKTDATWAGTCRQLILRLNDLSEHTALFQFR